MKPEPLTKKKKIEILPDEPFLCTKEQAKEIKETKRFDYFRYASVRSAYLWLRAEIEKGSEFKEGKEYIELKLHRRLCEKAFEAVSEE